MIDLPDIDIDFADRTSVLKHISHTPARLETGKRHNTGVYFTDIPRASEWNGKYAVIIPGSSKEVKENIFKKVDRILKENRKY